MSKRAQVTHTLSQQAPDIALAVVIPAPAVDRPDGVWPRSGQEPAQHTHTHTHTHTHHRNKTTDEPDATYGSELRNLLI